MIRNKRNAKMCRIETEVKNKEQPILTHPFLIYT